MADKTPTQIAAEKAVADKAAAIIQAKKDAETSAAEKVKEVEKKVAEKVAREEINAEIAEETKTKGPTGRFKARHAGSVTIGGFRFTTIFMDVTKFPEVLERCRKAKNLLIEEGAE